MIVLGTAAGCGTDAPNAGGQASELEVARDQFDGEIGDSYAFTWRYSCGECIAETNRPVRVTVANGAITSMMDLETAAAVTADSRGGVRTIQAVFELVEAAEGGAAASTTVIYDDELGYPATVSIDVIAEAVDDEYGITITNVVAE